MLNQIVLVGRLSNEPEIQETESGKSMANLVLAVSRSFKNSEGEYETDFIKCKLWNNIATNTCEYCKKGDLVGIKGRLQTFKNQDNFVMEVVAEKVTFLSNKSKEAQQER